MITLVAAGIFIHLEIFQETGAFWCFFCPMTKTEIGLIK